MHVHDCVVLWCVYACVCMRVCVSVSVCFCVFTSASVYVSGFHHFDSTVHNILISSLCVTSGRNRHLLCSISSPPAQWHFCAKLKIESDQKQWKIPT